MRQTLKLTTVGLGIVFYSPFAVAGIREEENYLSTSFTKPADVAAHLMRCGLAAFCTGSGGDYDLFIYDGPLDLEAMNAAKFKVRLGLEVRGKEVCFRDLYDLISWLPNCPEGQGISVPAGFYKITVYSSPPSSGIIGPPRDCTAFRERRVATDVEVVWRTATLLKVLLQLEYSIDGRLKT